jgi:hypothetical protein
MCRHADREAKKQLDVLVPNASAIRPVSHTGRLDRNKWSKPDDCLSEKK